MIWQNCLDVEEYASDLAELPVPVSWQLSASDLAELPRDVEELHGSDLAELPAPVIWQNRLYMEEYASDLALTVILQKCVSVDSVPVIWQNCLYREVCQ